MKCEANIITNYEYFYLQLYRAYYFHIVLFKNIKLCNSFSTNNNNNNNH